MDSHCCATTHVADFFLSYISLFCCREEMLRCSGPTQAIWPRLFCILEESQFRAGIHGKVFRGVYINFDNYVERWEP